MTAADGEYVIPPPSDEAMAMQTTRARFTIRGMMVAVAAVGIALAASRLSRPDLFHVYGLAVLGLIGLSPILICYLWLRERPGRELSPSIERLIGMFAVILVLCVVSWAMLAW
jgi:Na+/melibiose symporter-like transporter